MEIHSRVAPSELWLRDDLDEVHALLLVTQKFVILVRDPVGFAPWPVLLHPGEPCDSCQQDTPPLVERCFL